MQLRGLLRRVAAVLLACFVTALLMGSAFVAAPVRKTRPEICSAWGDCLAANPVNGRRRALP